MPNYLFYDFDGQVYLYANASPSPVGDPLGGSAFTKQVYKKSRDSVIKFQGELYAFSRDGIYQKNDPTSDTGAWTSVLTFTNPPDFTNGAPGGLYPVVIGGVPYLATYWYGTAGGFNWAKFDGTTWTQGASGVTNANTPFQMDTLVYRNVIFGAWGNSGGSLGGYYSFDPGTETVAPISAQTTPTDFRSVALCVFQDKLMTWVPSTTTGKIAEYIGGSFVDRATVTPGYGSSSLISPASGAALFTDGTYLYLMYEYYNNGNTLTGLHCQRSADAIIWTNISDPVIPPGLRPQTYNGTAPTTSGAVAMQVRALYDVDTTPGTTDIYLYLGIHNNIGDAFTVFRWVDSSTELEFIDVGGQMIDACPSGYPNTGERIWSPSSLDVCIVSRSGVTGGEQISFVAYGGGTGHSFKLYYGLQTEPVLLEATLAAPVTGGSATFNGGLNRVEGIAADGTTVYTVVWNIVADGLASGDRVIHAPRIIV